MKFSDSDLKEIFALFQTVTNYELEQIYHEDTVHHYEKINLEEEYELNQEKREFVFDSLRSVLFFLDKKGYGLIERKTKKIVDLSFSHNYFN